MQAIQLYSEAKDPFEQIQKTGEWFVKSGLFSGCDRLEQGTVLAMVCWTENKAPREVIDNYHIIDGKLSRKSASASALFQKAGGTIKWIKHGKEPDQNDKDRYVIAEFEYKGEKTTVEWSMEDARRAELVRKGSAWEKMPWKMLRARAISEGVGMLAPEVYCGDIDDGDPAPPAQREIKLSSAPEHEPTQKVTVETEAPPAAKEKPSVVDAEVVNETPAPVNKNPEPVNKVQKGTTKPTPEPEPNPPDNMGDLKPDLIDQVEKAIGADAQVCVDELRRLGWIQPGQNISHLREDQARKLIRQIASFKEKAKENAK